MKCRRSRSLFSLFASLPAALAVMHCACVTQPVKIEFPPEHPALASAREAPLPPLSNTLAMDSTHDTEALLHEREHGSSAHVHAPAAGAASTSVEAKPASPTPAPNTTGGKPDGAKDVYTCPMHADVLSDKPGHCPKCGMNLAKKPKPDHREGGGQ